MATQEQPTTQQLPSSEAPEVQPSTTPAATDPAAQTPNVQQPSTDLKNDEGGVYATEVVNEKSSSQYSERPNPAETKKEDSSQDLENGPQEHRSRSRPWRRYRSQIRWLWHFVVFALFTGWWIAGLILRRKDLGWVVPFLVWLCIILRLLFLYVPISVITKPTYAVWNHTVPHFLRLIPEKFQTLAGAILVVAVILIGAFVSEESQDNTRENRAVSVFGLAVLVFVLWATSRDRKKIVWRTVIVGMLIQFVISLFVLRTQAGFDIFKFVSDRARDLLGFASDGTVFLSDDSAKQSTWFLVSVVPAIIFFVALVQLLYYTGLLQWFIGKFASFFFWAMRVSGAEAVVAAASPFIGQGESAMLIRPFVNHLTMAEIHQIMCSGFATIAGSVLIAYISMGVNAQVLISSCVMSIPASLAVSKLRYPETEETLTAGRVVIPDEDEENRPANALHAFASGAWLGLKIGAMIAATLLCIISLIALINGLLTWWGRYLNINDPPLTVELIVGYICYPIAFLLGVPRNDDLVKVGQLIGIKLIANEFVAYNAMQTDPTYADLSPRSRLIATYALCGFANIGSLGNQIGVLSHIAPRRTGDVSRVAISAMLTGALSTLSSASIAGLVVTDQQQFFNPPSG